MIQYSTPVEYIEVVNHHVQSVTAASEIYHARKAYISDLDPKLTVQLIRGAKELSKQEYQRLTGYEYSASAFNIYLGLDQRFDHNDTASAIGISGIIPMATLNQAYQQQLEGNFDHPWIFLSCPTIKSTEPGMAPSRSSCVRNRYHLPL